MSSGKLSVVFVSDPRWSPQVRVAYGGAEEPWAAVELHGGRGHWPEQARRAVCVLRALMTEDDIRAADLQTAAGVPRQELIATWHVALEDQKPLGFARPETEETEETEETVETVDLIYQRLCEHLATHGAHPDFSSTKQTDVRKCNNYITSVWGRPLPTKVCDAVRARLRGKS